MNKLKKIIILTLFVFLLNVPSLLFAESGKMNFLLDSDKITRIFSGKNFSEIFSGLFKIIVYLASIWAVITIAFYGAKYALVDSFTAKKDSLNQIWPAIYGLLALLATYIIFNQINSKMLEMSIDGAVVVKEQKTSSSAGDSLDIREVPVFLPPTLNGLTPERLNELYGNDNKFRYEVIDAFIKECQTKYGARDCNSTLTTLQRCYFSAREDACKQSVQKKYLDLFRKIFIEKVNKNR